MKTRLTGAGALIKAEKDALRNAKKDSSGYEKTAKMYDKNKETYEQLYSRGHREMLEYLKKLETLRHQHADTKFAMQIKSQSPTQKPTHASNRASKVEVPPPSTSEKGVVQGRKSTPKKTILIAQSASRRTSRNVSDRDSSERLKGSVHEESIWEPHPSSLLDIQREGAQQAPTTSKTSLSNSASLHKRTSLLRRRPTPYPMTLARGLDLLDETDDEGEGDEDEDEDERLSHLTASEKVAGFVQIWKDRHAHIDRNALDLGRGGSNSLLRKKKRRLSAIEKLLEDISISKHTIAAGIDPESFLNCSYLRLSKQNVEQLETMMRVQGRDPGIHRHLNHDEINQNC